MKQTSGRKAKGKAAANTVSEPAAVEWPSGMKLAEWLLKMKPGQASIQSIMAAVDQELARCPAEAKRDIQKLRLHAVAVTQRATTPYCNLCLQTVMDADPGREVRHDVLSHKSCEINLLNRLRQQYEKATLVLTSTTPQPAAVRA